jgi:hypothetical protein
LQSFKVRNRFELHASEGFNSEFQVSKAACYPERAAGFPPQRQKNARARDPVCGESKGPYKTKTVWVP